MEEPRSEEEPETTTACANCGAQKPFTEPCPVCGGMKNRGGRPRTKDQVNVNLSVYVKDRDLLELITNYYGCSRSEAFRLMVRYFAIHLDIERDREP